MKLAKTRSFLFSAIAIYVSLSLFLHLVLHVVGRRWPVPLDPLPRPPLPSHGPRLHRHLRRHPTFLPCRDLRHPVVLAPHQDDPFPLAALFPPRDSLRWPDFLLVVRLLPLLVPSPPLDLLHDRRATAASVGEALQPLVASVHVLPLARVLAVVPGGGDSLGNTSVRVGLRVPVLDRGGAASGRCLPDGGGVLGGAAGVQPGLPSRGPPPPLQGCCNRIGAWVFNSMLNTALLLFLNFHVKRALWRGRQRAMAEKRKERVFAGVA